MDIEHKKIKIKYIANRENGKTKIEEVEVELAPITVEQRNNILKKAMKIKMVGNQTIMEPDPAEVIYLTVWHSIINLNNEQKDKILKNALAGEIDKLFEEVDKLNDVSNLFHEQTTTSNERKSD